MPLIDLDITAEPTALPADIVDFLNEADTRIDEFVARRLDTPVPGFHPSDFSLVYQMLEKIRNIGVAPGERFCEWGSGFGVVASLAALLGFESYGIEIEEDLVEAAQKLAVDFEFPATFVRGSFIPDQCDHAVQSWEDFSWLVSHGASGYDELDLEPDDFDVIFAYPWPGEEQVIENIFDECSAAGAILLSYHGCEEIRVRRKRAARRD